MPGFDVRADLKVNDIETVEQIESLKYMEQKLFNEFSCIRCEEFQVHFDQMAFNQKVRKEFKEIQYRLSDESLQLLPEYDQRLNVLKGLKYVDDDTGAVQLKGRISCEINNHELMITGGCQIRKTLNG
jgi:antiviral helicase SKI2